ncbi:citrate lyase ACP [Synergistales bacterium]|nr:citrate lyase ACP [Synergistales bacterium]
MSDTSSPKAGQAGTVESMDCLVTVSESPNGRVIELAGASASRFKDAMEAKINSVLSELEKSFGEKTRGVKVSVQDNGALDLILGARVEAACRRFFGR